MPTPCHTPGHIARHVTLPVTHHVTLNSEIGTICPVLARLAPDLPSSRPVAPQTGQIGPLAAQTGQILSSGGRKSVAEYRICPVCESSVPICPVCGRNSVVGHRRAHSQRHSGRSEGSLVFLHCDFVWNGEGSFGCAGPSPPWRRLPSPTDSPPGCPLHGSVLRMTRVTFRHPERSPSGRSRRILNFLHY